MEKTALSPRSATTNNKFYVDENKSYHAEPDCKYCVKMRTDNDGWRLVCHIPDFAQNPKGVAEGLAEILNRESKLILPI